MGNRRLGARRLDSLLRRGTTGKDTSYQAGPGISGAIVSHRMFNEGVFIVTEIVVDLGASGVNIVSSDGADEAFGVAASGGCQLMQWENDIHGQFLFSEAFVVETFTTVTAVSLSSGTAVNAVSDTITGRADVQAGIATNALGSASAHGGSTALADGEYLYLTADNGTETTMNAGQIIIRLVGAKPTDISKD
tara:strand:- start:1742 stop:2317 length:576 start_codon:yes stop_codon:yes gene_type:complete